MWLADSKLLTRVPWTKEAEQLTLKLWSKDLTCWFLNIALKGLEEWADESGELLKRKRSCLDGKRCQHEGLYHLPINQQNGTQKGIVYFKHRANLHMVSVFGPSAAAFLNFMGWWPLHATPDGCPCSIPNSAHLTRASVSFVSWRKTTKVTKSSTPKLRFLDLWWLMMVYSLMVYNGYYQKNWGWSFHDLEIPPSLWSVAPLAAAHPAGPACLAKFLGVTPPKATNLGTPMPKGNPKPHGSHL